VCCKGERSIIGDAYYIVMASLTAGLEAMRAAAKLITAQDLDQHDRETAEKLHSNPLGHSFHILRTVLLQQSEEARAREAKRRKEVTNAAKPAKSAKEPKPAKEPKDLYGNQLGLSGTSGPSAPPTTVTPVIRKASDSSYGPGSTETTPKRLKAPEGDIQNLQNTLVQDVLNALYHDNAVPVSWAKNRETMRIEYRPFVHPCICN
jgi:hypothetical protein